MPHLRGVCFYTSPIVDLDIAHTKQSYFFFPFRPASPSRSPVQPIDEIMEFMDESFRRDQGRLTSEFSPQLLERIKRARTKKILNKTREKERERAGEVLNSTLRRDRKGVPPHAWVKMSVEDQEKVKERRRAAIATTLTRRGYTSLL